MGTVKALAANVDQVVITIAIAPVPSLYLLDSYLVASETLGLRSVILCNKSDLMSPRPHPIQTDLDYYTALGYPVLFVNTMDQSGFSELRQRLSHRNNVLVGQSGVGKTSLMNTLILKATGKIQALSNAQGRHTTTHSYLHVLQGAQGTLIDSPGVRSFTLNHLSEQALLKGFIELAQLSKQCRFKNCDHQNPSNCAVLAAIEGGTVAAYRLAHYKKMKRQFGAT